MDKRLIIRIKMPPAGSKLRFECPSCQKSFGSGKALGGHKRAHLRASTNNHSRDRSTSELQITQHPESKNAHQNIHRCPICQQPFLSEKAVHGHMRKHRDRNWRGMRPPIPRLVAENCDSLPPASGAVALLDKQLDVASDVQTSGSVGRRRPRHGKAPIDLVPELTDNESISVAYDLIALAHGEPRKKQKLEARKSRSVVIEGGGERPCRRPPPPVDEGPSCCGGEKEKDDNQSRPVFSFDLNELPPPEEEEEAGSGGDGGC